MARVFVEYSQPVGSAVAPRRGALDGAPMGLEVVGASMSMVVNRDGVVSAVARVVETLLNVVVSCPVAAMVETSFQK